MNAQSLEPTYEGLKHRHRLQHRVRRFRFGAYLRGIETVLRGPPYIPMPTFGAYLRGIETAGGDVSQTGVAPGLEPTYEGLKQEILGLTE